MLVSLSIFFLVILARIFFLNPSGFLIAFTLFSSLIKFLLEGLNYKTIVISIIISVFVWNNNHLNNGEEKVITISNTDDHLRNHGFILTSLGWILSPVYDLNPSIDKDGLALNIDLDHNALDYDLAKSVGVFFRLTENQMDSIMHDVKALVSTWENEADKMGIAKKEQILMAKAFKK